MKIRTKIMAVLGLLALCSVGPADELLVPSQYPTIQAAIADANSGDTVLVADGVYTGAGNRDIDFLGKAVTVRSENGPNNCIIDCNGTEAEPHRGFYFHSGEDANSIVDGFTITNGYVLRNGGGLYCEGASPLVKNCIFNANLGRDGIGGGIACVSGNPKIINCTFNENSAKYGGGGVYNYNSNATITNCVFSRNSTGGDGGGVYNHDSNATITNCTFTANTANKGGGMCNIEYSSPIVTNCTFTANTAGVGGGMCNRDYSNPMLTNCTFSGNASDSHGGGMYNRNSSPTLTNCTFSENSAGSDYAYASGGGVYNDEFGSLTLTNCILWGNTAPTEPQIYNNETSSVTVSYSDVQSSWPGTGNIDEDPCFVDPGHWDANGTPADANDDFWVDGDYHLKSEGWRWDTKRKVWTWDDVTSRCIDAGNPGSPFGDELLSVPVDPNNIWGENLRINMGAYGGTAEASMPPYDWAILGDLTNDGLVNLKDYTFQAADWRNSADQQPGDLNRDSLVDISDVALLVEDWLRQTTWHE